jgi:hypothetical protein
MSHDQNSPVVIEIALLPRIIFVFSSFFVHLGVYFLKFIADWRIEWNFDLEQRVFLKFSADFMDFSSKDLL